MGKSGVCRLLKRLPNFADVLITQQMVGASLIQHASERADRLSSPWYEVSVGEACLCDVEQRLAGFSQPR